MSDDPLVRTVNGRDVVWEPQPRQDIALRCPALELCFGGGKGGGKTDLLVVCCIWQIMLCHEKWLKTGRKQRGRYIIFRRNLKNLQDIIQRAEEIYPSIDPNATRPTQQKNWWTFESGYRVEFAHLDGPDDHKGYNGQELCVATGTPLLGGDGKYRPIESYEVGDMVMTLEGPKRVLAVHRNMMKPCVRADVYDGASVKSQIHPETHPVLTPTGWVSYSGLAGARSDTEASRKNIPGYEPPGEYFFPVVLHAPVRPSEESRSGQGPTSSRDLDISHGQHQETSEAGLASPSGQPLPSEQARSTPGYTESTSRVCDGGYDLRGSRRDQGSHPDCQPSSRLDGEQSPDQTGICLGAVPSRDDAGGPSLFSTRQGALDSTLRYSHLDATSYVHFYTKQRRRASEASVYGACSLTPVGVQSVCDLTVEDANHYIGDSGLINCNTGLGFDQVEEIPEHVYSFLTMQVRSKDADMRKLLFVRCTANPGGPHAQWVKDYFINGCKPHNTIIKSEVKLRGGRIRETTKAFVPAKLYDNKYLAEDGAYEATLMKLPEHLRRMYLEGDWDVVVGAYFAHVWKKDVHVIPSFPIPGSWPVKFGLDWGTSAPACTLWAARDNDGNLYFIDELYCPGITGRTYGEKMLKKLEAQKWSSEKRWGVKDMYGLIDRQAMAATGSDGAGPSTPAAGIQWCGWRIFPANKDRAASIEQWLERLLLKPNGKPSIYIFGDRCPHLASTMPALMADPHNPNDVDSSGDDHCLVGSTLVETSDGPVAISDLVGKEGWTYGIKGERIRFKNVRLTRDDTPIMRVTVADGRTITCTPDHLIMTQDGWKPAGALTLQDHMQNVIVSECKIQSSSQERLRSTQASAITSAGSISSGQAQDFIARSGQMQTVLCQGDSTSIILTKTGQTMLSKISLASRQAAMSASTQENLTLAGAQQRLSTLGSMQLQQMQGSLSSSAHGQLAEAGRAQWQQTESARSAAGHFSPEATVRRGSAEGSAATISITRLEDAGRSKVYDLDVESDDHGFAVQGGLIVHNCFDASRFVLMDWPVNDARKKQHKGDAEVERWLELARQRKEASESSDDVITTGYGD